MRQLRGLLLLGEVHALLLPEPYSGFKLEGRTRREGGLGFGQACRDGTFYQEYGQQLARQYEDV